MPVRTVTGVQSSGGLPETDPVVDLTPYENPGWKPFLRRL